MRRRLNKDEIRIRELERVMAEILEAKTLWSARELAAEAIGLEVYEEDDEDEELEELNFDD